MLVERLGSDLGDDIAAAGRGDRTAMQRVFAASAGRLLAVIVRVTGDRAAAEDVLQETFIKVWNRAASYDPARGTPMVWLGTIARTSAIDWYRAHRRHVHEGEEAIPLLADDVESADLRMIREEEQARAIESLGSLSPEHEGELRDTFFRGLTYAQLAHSKGIPLPTLKSRIRRSLLALRRTLDSD